MLSGLKQKLEMASKSLASWGSSTFQSVRHEIRMLKHELDEWRNSPARVGTSHAKIKVIDRLVELYHREETMWRQRSWIRWLSQGNKNYRGEVGFSTFSCRTTRTWVVQAHKTKTLMAHVQAANFHNHATPGFLKGNYVVSRSSGRGEKGVHDGMKKDTKAVTDEATN